MSDQQNPRRSFLKRAGVAIASAGVVAMPEAAVAQAANSTSKAAFYDVTTFGAKGDGQNIDTPAINAAIEAASNAGGGTVIFPGGTYVCYSIHLKSHVAVQLSEGVTIVAADSTADGKNVYDPAESNKPWESYQDFGHNHWHNSLIWGENLQNASIQGPGLIWGKGLSRGDDEHSPRAEDPGIGNKTIALKNCHNVLLRDFAILHGGHFGILATGVDNLTIDNLLIDTNRDGMDVDCCRNVRISNCSVNAPGDDGICLKSSYALGYARATEMVTITNCLLSGDFQEGTLLDATYKPIGPNTKIWRAGRIKFGTESNGGFKNITISNCVFDTCHGLSLESVDGALLEDVTITNITMRNILDGPIFLRLGARMRGPADIPIGKLRRITISNIVCSNATGSVSSIISGLPGHEIEDIKLSNIYIHHRGGGSAKDAARKLEEKEGGYPEPDMFGVTPSHGFFIRHVRGLEMTGIKIVCENEDARPAFVLDDVRGADFLNINVPRIANQPVFALRNVEDFCVNSSKAAPDTKLQNVEQKNI